jgi:hypothetical protein
VSFELMRQSEELGYVGKEDLNRMAHRVGEFLVEIKKASWEYKQVLAQHNKRHEKFHLYETSNYFLYALKAIAMLGVITVQIWLVRKIFV